MIKVKRIYEPPTRDDGKRVLVDRLWPRGIKKEDASIDEWLKDIAPSDALRKWFAHDPERWEEFKKKYINELKSKSDLLKRINQEARHKTVTLLFAAKDEKHNNAVILKEILERR